MRKFYLLCIVLMAITISCTDNSANAESQSFNQSIAGSIKLNDINISENKVLSDLSGVKISVDGTDKSAITDVNGNWSIQNVPIKSENSSSGNIIIKFEKNGYAVIKERYRIEKNNGTFHLSSQSIKSLPKFYPDSLTYIIVNEKIEFSGVLKTNDSLLKTNWININKMTILFSSKSSLVNNLLNYEYDYEYRRSQLNKTFQFKISIPLSEIYKNGYKSGQSVFFVSACFPQGNYSQFTYYENGFSGRKIPGCYNRRLSNEITVVLP